MDGLEYIRSAKGLVERLNNATCVGCHQLSGTAGFHMLGRAGGLNSAFNQVIVPFSPHYAAERERRSDYLKALAAKEPISTFRPLSLYPAGGVAQSRDLCLLDTNDFKAGFTCAADSVCRKTLTNAEFGVAIGECVMKQNSVAGHVCREDYICQQLPEDVARLYSNGQTNALVRNRIKKLGDLGIGFCVPNYFVFNMRSDGHIIPEGR